MNRLPTGVAIKGFSLLFVVKLTLCLTTWSQSQPVTLGWLLPCLKDMCSGCRWRKGGGWVAGEAALLCSVPSWEPPRATQTTLHIHAVTVTSGFRMNDDSKQLFTSVLESIFFYPERNRLVSWIGCHFLLRVWPNTDSRQTQGHCRFFISHL